MASLDLDRAIKTGFNLIDKHKGYGMVASQFDRFHKMEEWDKIARAFYFGVCQGAKIGRKEKNNIIR